MGIEPSPTEWLPDTANPLITAVTVYVNKIYCAEEKQKSKKSPILWFVGCVFYIYLPFNLCVAARIREKFEKSFHQNMNSVKI